MAENSYLDVGAFFATSPNPCGLGTSLGLLMLGICLGMLSLAGSSRLRRRRK